MPIDQSVFPEPCDASESEALRRAFHAGCHLLADAADALARVRIFAVGPMVPEALWAVEPLEREGIGINLCAVKSPDLLFRYMQARSNHEAFFREPRPRETAGLLWGDELGGPTVTVVNGYPHVVAFIGCCRTINVGVSSFGQSGSRMELCRHFGIDTE